MKSVILSFTVSAVLILATTQVASGWGQNGHRITAEIAERNLTPETKAAILKIAGGESLAELSTWADEIRSDGTWDFAQPWHYISIDDEETWEDYERVPEDEGDVLSILERLEKILRSPDAETFTLTGIIKGRGSSLRIVQKKEVTKRDVLALYIHFVGDIHQPLHVGRRDDQGGNKIQVKWFQEETTLHKLWDEHLIDSMSLSYTEYATFLNRATDEEKAAWGKASYLDWAKESREVREQVYDFGAQKKSYFLNIVEAPSLGYDYRAKTKPILTSRLKKAGFRLAAKLNDIFGGE